uniref:Solute carrier family 39 (Zinc transporter), member 3 n=1 Tax=Pan troglodytes TaxID=9598 RepID=K7C7E4_PANTR
MTPCETWSVGPSWPAPGFPPFRAETPHSCCCAWLSLHSFVTRCVKTDICTARMEILVISDVSCIPEATASPPFPPWSWCHPRHPLTAGLGDCGELALPPPNHSGLLMAPKPFPPFSCPRAGQADEVPTPEPPASPTAGPGSQSPLENGAWFTAPVHLPHLS